MQKTNVGVEFVDEYLNLLSETVNRISRQDIWKVVQALFAAWRDGRQIFLLGNGGSAATASHMANDLNKYTLVDGKRRMRAIALTDNVPLMTAWGNDSAYEDIFAEQLLNFVQSRDVVIAISASGNSPNVIKALQVARAQGAQTIGFTGDRGGKLKELVDQCIFIPDPQIGRQEDGHMILDHVIALALRQMIVEEGEH